MKYNCCNVPFLSYLNWIGMNRGNEETFLTTANLPSHFHYAASSSGVGDDNYHSTFYPVSSSGSGGSCADLAFAAGSANQGQSSIGSGTSFNIMQPTVFVGNLLHRKW